jgi:histidine triad (HIT) family protein/ATP adenylyltransferase
MKSSIDHARKPIDLKRLHEASVSGLCFICEFLNSSPGFNHTVLAETENSVAFLNKYPTLYGATIVAPRRHIEGVTGGCSEAEYLELQSFIYRVSEGIRKVLSPERIYILSLGSKSANAHVHWHISPLPPGLPLEEQQYHALMHEHGVVQISEDEGMNFVKEVRAVLAN